MKNWKIITIYMRPKITVFWLQAPSTVSAIINILWHSPDWIPTFMKIKANTILYNNKGYP